MVKFTEEQRKLLGEIDNLINQFVELNDDCTNKGELTETQDDLLYSMSDLQDNITMNQEEQGWI